MDEKDLIRKICQAITDVLDSECTKDQKAFFKKIKLLESNMKTNIKIYVGGEHGLEIEVKSVKQ